MPEEIVSKYEDLNLLARKRPPSLFFRALVRVGYCLGVSDRQDCDVLVHLSALRNHKDELLARGDTTKKVRKYIKRYI